MSKTTFRAFALVVICLAAGLGLPPGQTEWSLFGQESGPPMPPKHPNIVLILADDMRKDDLQHTPKIRTLLVERGTTFENAFVTDSICCPSRASLLRGQYPHNHGVLTAHAATGAFNAFYSLGRENSTVATWLQEGGYRTVLLGKYFNGYFNDRAPETYIPPGWDEWYGSDGYGVRFNENGTLATYDPDQYNPTDMLGDRAADYIRRSSADPGPFFMYLAPKPPHLQATVAARHRDAYEGERAPRVPSFNEFNVRDKPSWVRKRPLFSSEALALVDERYRHRLRTLLALDEMVERVVAALEDSGELDDTYIFFSSDNGFRLGEHRLMPAKQTAYEEDIRVPLVVRGPGVPSGHTLGRMVLNNDLAPTFAELGGVSAPDFVDGRSLKPLLDGSAPPGWRKAFLIEKYGDLVMPYRYEAVRTANYTFVQYSNGERELYDLRTDPYQLRSIHDTANPRVIHELRSRIRELRSCAGTGCHVAENSPWSRAGSRVQRR